MSELSISNVIRVTVQGVQRSRTVKNVNEVALFTPEVPNNIQESMYVIDPSDVAEAYGTNSLTYKMALNVFAQNANLLSGRGALIVIPMENSVNATAATFTTPDISDISDFSEVRNGSLTVTADGVVYIFGGATLTEAGGSVSNKIYKSTDCVVWEEVAEVPESYTGKYVKKILERDKIER